MGDLMGSLSQLVFAVQIKARLALNTDDFHNLLSLKLKKKGLLLFLPVSCIIRFHSLIHVNDVCKCKCNFKFYSSVAWHGKVFDWRSTTVLVK